MADKYSKLSTSGDHEGNEEEEVKVGGEGHINRSGEIVHSSSIDDATTTVAYSKDSHPTVLTTAISSDSIALDIIVQDQNNTDLDESSQGDKYLKLDTTESSSDQLKSGEGEIPIAQQQFIADSKKDNIASKSENHHAVSSFASASSTSFPTLDIQRDPLSILLDAGFPEEASIEALFISNGDVDSAITYLIDNPMAIPMSNGNLFELLENGNLPSHEGNFSNSKKSNTATAAGGSASSSSPLRRLRPAIADDARDEADNLTEEQKKQLARDEMHKTLEGLRSPFPPRFRTFCCPTHKNNSLKLSYDYSPWICSLSARHPPGKLPGSLSHPPPWARFKCDAPIEANSASSSSSASLSSSSASLSSSPGSTCEFNYCGHCFEFNYRVSLPRCDSGHVLVSQKKRNGWVCNGTGECKHVKGSWNVEDQERWRCIECDFDFCGPCYEFRLYAMAERHKINLVNPQDTKDELIIAKRRNSDPISTGDDKNKQIVPKLQRIPSDPITYLEKSAQNNLIFTSGSVLLHRASGKLQLMFMNGLNRRGSLRSEVVKTSTCKICYENFPLEEMFDLSSCYDHKYCKPCLAGYCNAQINDGVVNIHCPEYYICNRDINDDVDSIVDADFYSRWMRIKKIKTDKRYRECPTCNQGTNTGGVKNPVLTCVACQTVFCFVHNNAHPNMTCDQYLKSLPARVRKELQESSSFIRVAAKNCPGCDAPTEKSSGCNHMTCIECKCNWCWICNQDLQNDVSSHYNLTNIRGCPGAQFADVSLFDNLAVNLSCIPGLASCCRTRCFYCFMSCYAAIRTITYVIFLLSTYGVILLVHFAGFVATAAAAFPFTLLYEIGRHFYEKYSSSYHYFECRRTCENIFFKPGMLGVYLVWGTFCATYVSISLAPAILAFLVTSIMTQDISNGLEVAYDIVLLWYKFTQNFMDD